MSSCNCNCHNNEGIKPEDNVFTELGFKIAVLNDLKESRAENKSLQKAVTRLRAEVEKLKDSIMGWKGGYNAN